MKPTILETAERVLDVIEASNKLEAVAARVWSTLPDTAERKELATALGKLVEATRAAERFVGDPLTYRRT